MLSSLPHLRATVSSLDNIRGELLNQRIIRSLADSDALLEMVRAEMAAEGYSDTELFSVRIGLDEAIRNALKHGNRGDARKHVRVQWEVSEHRVLLAVEDQGQGFDPAAVLDARAAENILKPCGRGLLLMRHFLTWLRYNDRGNRVLLCKLRGS
jgi:serine/threonine-protein kinase RsbW